MIPAHLESLALASQYWHEFMHRHVMSDDTRYAVDLALCEALSNIIRHGKLDDSACIEIEFLWRDHAVKIILRDQGVSIPATLLSQVQLSQEEGDQNKNEISCFDSTPLADLPEGGMGLMLIFSLMDEVHYQSSSNVNELTLLKSIN